MIRTGRKRKPCPGCGEVSLSRKADEVCHTCQSLLSEAKALRAHALKKKDSVVIRLPFADYCLPGLLHFPERTRVKRLFFDLIHSVGVEVPWQGEVQDRPFAEAGEGCCSSSREDKCWRIPRSFKVALVALYNELNTSSREIFEEGKEDGHRFVIGLATGDTSIDEFNEASTKNLANKRRSKRRQ